MPSIPPNKAHVALAELTQRIEAAAFRFVAFKARLIAEDRANLDDLKGFAGFADWLSEQEERSEED